MATKLEELQTRRAAYVAAELRILQRQESQVGQGGNSRRLVLAELETVRQTIKDLDADISKETAASTGARRAYAFVPGRL